MSNEKFDERVRHFAGFYDKDNCGFDAATEGHLNPFNDDDLRAYATAHFRWLLSDDEFVVETESPISEMVCGAVFMARSLMIDAFSEWARSELGETSEEELLGAMEDDEEVFRLIRAAEERRHKQLF